MDNLKPDKYYDIAYSYRIPAGHGYHKYNVIPSCKVKELVSSVKEKLGGNLITIYWIPVKGVGLCLRLSK